MRRSVLALILFLGVAIAAFAPIRSYDAFWNLASGRWIVDHHALSVSDPLAITSVKTPWINGEWLWQVIALPFGEGGASWLVAFLIGATFALAFYFASREHDAGLAVAVAAVAFAGASDRLGVRPLTAASLLIVLAIALLARRDLAPPRLAIAYAALTIIWINTHPSALLAPVLAAITLFIDWRRWIVVAGSVVALFINPYGWNAVVAPVRLATTVTSGAFVNAEWQRSPLALFPLLYASIAVVVIWYLATPEKLRNAWRFLIFSALAALAVGAVRNQALYFAALPLLVPPSKKVSRNLSAGFAIAALIPIIWAISATDHFGGTDNERFPVRAAARLRASQLKGNIYNVDQFGGYLEWTLYPERRVLTDGRNELFTSFIAEDAEAHHDSRAWHNLLTKYKVDLAVDEYAAPIEKVDVATGERHMEPASLVRYRRRDWALIAFDDTALVFARRAAFPAAQLAQLEYRTLVPDGPGILNIGLDARAIAQQEVARAKREIGDIRIVRELERGAAETS